MSADAWVYLALALLLGRVANITGRNATGWVLFIFAVGFLIATAREVFGGAR